MAEREPPSEPPTRRPRAHIAQHSLTKLVAPLLLLAPRYCAVLGPDPIPSLPSSSSSSSSSFIIFSFFSPSSSFSSSARLSRRRLVGPAFGVWPRAPPTPSSGCCKNYTSRTVALVAFTCSSVWPLLAFYVAYHVRLAVETKGCDQPSGGRRGNQREACTSVDG